MQQQLAVALRIVVRIGAVAVRIDVASEQPDFIVPHRRVGILERHLGITERFHLGAAEHEPGFERLEDLVVVTRLAIRGDRPIARLAVLTRHDRTVSWPPALLPKWRNWQT